MQMNNMVVDVRVAKQILAYGRLTFGDLDQIRAVKALLRAEEEKEGKSLYRVTVRIEGDYTVEVYASSEDEARDMIDRDDYMDDLDVDVHVKKLADTIESEG